MKRERENEIYCGDGKTGQEKCLEQQTTRQGHNEIEGVGASERRQNK